MASCPDICLFKVRNNLDSDSDVSGLLSTNFSAGLPSAANEPATLPAPNPNAAPTPPIAPAVTAPVTVGSQSTSRSAVYSFHPRGPRDLSSPKGLGLEERAHPQRRRSDLPGDCPVTNNRLAARTGADRRALLARVPFPTPPALNNRLQLVRGLDRGPAGCGIQVGAFAASKLNARPTEATGQDCGRRFRPDHWNQRPPVAGRALERGVLLILSGLSREADPENCDQREDECGEGDRQHERRQRGES